MEHAFDPSEVLLRTGLAYITLMIATKFLGKQTIAHMNLFEFTAAFSLASIAANLSFNLNLNKWNVLIALTGFTLLAFAASLLSLWSRRARSLLAGNPTVVIQDGEIMEERMKKLYYTIDYLKQQLRLQGYFDIDAIQTAILEPNGDLSVLPKPIHRPLTRGDFAMPSPGERFPVEVVVEGHILEQNLSHQRITREELLGQLQAKGAGKPEEVYYAVFNSKGELFVDFFRDRVR